ncbi:TfoX/Sxy family DNA transformation protein [Actinomadura scrupuli]|uniref:TfoX/Sxy family DNA transformation protein n=1 Tax=Actinomadura scrupuli TaxID=559629 RepID=UPI003D986DFE
MRRRQRPGTARAAADGMKLHRRVVRLDGHDHTVVGLRPGTTARYSTNRFHETWHVLSDRHGARLLGRLLWGLSYQSRPGTLVLIDRPFLTPTPFDADPADPIVLVPGWHTPLGDRAARDLRGRLPFTTAPAGTVRWRTFGLDHALADVRAWHQDHARDRPAADRWTDSGAVDRRGGVLHLRPASPWEARRWAVRAAAMEPDGPYRTTHEYFGVWDHGQEGEVQLFADFRRRVGVARRARAEVLAGPDAPADPGSLRAAVWHRGAVLSGEAALRVRDGRELGACAARWLAVAGVHTLDELAEIGPVTAYRRLREAKLPGLTLKMLWAMEAALTYRDWRTVPAHRKALLLAELDRSPGRATPA